MAIDMIVQEGSRITPGIRFTSDLPGANTSGRGPVLDLTVWAYLTGDGKTAWIRYTFFEKDIAALTVFHSMAAYG